MREAWQRPVEAARKKFFDCQIRLGSLGKDASRNEARAIAKTAYQAMADACWAYAQKKNLQGDSPESFPAEIAIALWRLVTEGLAGKRLQSFEDLFSAGAPRLSASEKTDIEWACRYVQAAKARIIDDPKPVKNVATWYGVKQRTVHDWMKSCGAVDLLRDFFLDAGERQRGELIVSRAQKRGEFYRRHGRGQAAVVTRDKKRTPV